MGFVTFEKSEIVKGRSKAIPMKAYQAAPRPGERNYGLGYDSKKFCVSGEQSPEKRKFPKKYLKE